VIDPDFNPLALLEDLQRAQANLMQSQSHLLKIISQQEQQLTSMHNLIMRHEHKLRQLERANEI